MTRTHLFPQLTLTVVTLLGLIVTSPPLIKPLAVSPVFAQTQNTSKTEADRLLQQGTQQLQRGQIREAIESWQKALTIYQEIGDRRGEAYSLGNLGIAYNSLSQHEKAIEFLEQVLSIFQEMGDGQSVTASLIGLGEAYSNLSEYEKAIELQQSL